MEESKAEGLAPDSGDPDCKDELRPTAVPVSIGLNSEAVLKTATEPRVAPVFQ
jgi:hypothetical protein